MNHRGSSGNSPASGLGHQTYNMDSLNRTSVTNAAYQRSNANPKILFSLLSHAAGRQGIEEDQFGRQNVSLNETMEYHESKMIDEFKVPSSAPQMNPAAIHQHSMTSSSSKAADLSAYREPDYYPQPQQQKVKSGNGAQPTAGDFLMPMYNRPRSKSMGNGCLVRRVPEQMNPPPPPPPVVNSGSSSYWCPGGLYNQTNNGTRSVSRATSRDSLVSFDESIASSFDDYGSSYSGGGGYSLPPFAAMFPPQFPYSSRRNTGDPSNFASSRRGRRIATDSADILLEDARSQLMRLTTDAGEGGRPRSPSSSSVWQPMDDLDEQYSLSQPPSPPGTTSSSLHSAHHHQQQAHYYSMLQQQVQPNVRKYSEGSHQLKSRLTPGMPWRQRTSSLQTGGAVHPAAAAAVAAAASQRYSNSLNKEEFDDQSVSGPLNLSCKRVKRKKYDPVSNWPYARRVNVAGNGAGSRYGSANGGGFPTSSLGYASSDMTASIDEGIDNDDDAASDCSSNSILKSILLQTPRGRSYSMSVCIGRQNNAAANYPSELSAAPAAWLARAKLRMRESNELSKASSPSGRSAMMASPSGQTSQQQPQQQQPRHQRVVLAKKNQIPVTARVIEYLNKILALVSHVPRFEQFTLADRRTLLLSSCGRLLLLCMAESNLEFAVTTVNDTTATTTLAASPSLSTLSELGIVAEQHISVFNGDEMENTSSSSASGTAAAGEDFLPRTSSFSSRHPSAVVDAETPTQHFVDTVQNFIRKCQALGIDVEEYRLMGAIALFQTGSAKLMRGDLADAMHADARQRLADYVQKTRPNEKLRYSNILLALRTLFGINCAMLQSLFYRPSPGAASFNEFICNALNAGAGVTGSDVTLELAKNDVVGVEFDVVDDSGGSMVADDIIS